MNSNIIHRCREPIFILKLLKRGKTRGKKRKHMHRSQTKDCPQDLPVLVRGFLILSRGMDDAVAIPFRVHQPSKVWTVVASSLGHESPAVPCATRPKSRR